MPAAKAVTAISGTITGRWTTTAPVMQELTRSQVKYLVFSRADGANLDTVRRLTDVPTLQQMDLSRIEARVMHNMDDPCDDWTPVLDRLNGLVHPAELGRHNRLGTVDHQVMNCPHQCVDAVR